MNKKINCQLVNILLNMNNEFSNKYCSVSSGNYDYEILLEDNFINKDMRSIKVDNGNQSICFTNQKNPVSFYNQSTRKNDTYYEEIHIHCNNLDEFDALVNYLYQSDYKDVIDEVDNIPHYDLISKGNFKDYELIMEPMTNEVMATRSLLNILSQKSKETIFRALAIHFCELVDRPSEVDINLVHNLNEIYKSNVVDNEDLFFSEEISNKLLNILNEENTYQSRVSKIPSQDMNFKSNEYIINIDDKGVEY